MDTALTTTASQLIPAPRIEELQDQFIRSQDVKQSSRDLYRRTLRQYFKWVEAKGYSLREITRVELLGYKEDLLSGGLSPLSVGSYITVVRKFYEWTEANRYYPNVAKGIKTPHRRQQFKKQALSEDQGRALLDHLRSKALRDYAIISTLIRTGIRCIELTRANVEDITYKQGKRVLLIWGKGRDTRDNFVVLTDKAYKPIADYLKSRGKVKGGDPLFTSSSHNNLKGRLTTRAISFIAKENLKEIGIDGREFTAHSLRHSTAVGMIKAGATLDKVQGALRHSSPATTQIYLQTIAEEMRLQEAPEELLDKVF